MPTIFTDCKDCVHLDWFPIEHNLNKKHKINLELLELLQIIFSYKLPPEIGIKIIKLKNDLELKQCSLCNNNLCVAHYQSGLKYGKTYLYKDNYSICDRCCWLNI